MTSLIPNQARIITVHGTSASGPVERVEVSGVPFLRVGVNGDAVLIQLGQIVEIRPMPYEDTTWDAVLDVTSAVFQVTREEILSDRKPERIVRARHAAWYVAVQLGVDSMAEIGRRCDCSAHGTVLHGVNHARDLMDTEKQFRSRVGRVLANFIGTNENSK